MQAVNAAYGSSPNCQTVVMKNDATSSSSNVCKVIIILFRRAALLQSEYFTESFISG